MPDFGRFGDNTVDEPSFDDIRRSDSFIDALAAGDAVVPQDRADEELAALLGGWRDEMRWPDSALFSESQAVDALNAGLAERPGRTVGEPRSLPVRSRRGLSVVGAAAAAVLCIGGFGAVVAGAGPGDALYGLRTMLFGAPKQVRDDQVALAARTEMQQVQELISQGDWEQAQQKLVAVSGQVAEIGDQQQKQELLDQFNDLSAKVVERDPQATAAPGITYTVPPSATELVPAEAPPTSVPDAPSASESTPQAPPASDSSTVPTSAAGQTSTPPPSPAKSTPATTSGAAPGTTASSAAPGTTASSAASTAARTQPATSSPSAAQATSPPPATPATTAPATTSVSAVSSSATPATSATSKAATTTPAPAEAGTTPAPSTAAGTSQAPVTTTAVPAPVSTTATAPAPATTTTVPAPVTTTTVVVVPAG